LRNLAGQLSAYPGDFVAVLVATCPIVHVKRIIINR
jgi:hypothetical protein